MRPSRLDPLFAALTTLPGTGPKLGKLYQRLLGREDAPARVLDLLFHLPSSTIDRRSRPVIRDVVPGSVATLAVTWIVIARRRRTGRACRTGSRPMTTPAH